MKSLFSWQMIAQQSILICQMIKVWHIKCKTFEKRSIQSNNADVRIQTLKPPNIFGVLIVDLCPQLQQQHKHQQTRTKMLLEISQQEHLDQRVSKPQILSNTQNQWIQSLLDPYALIKNQHDPVSFQHSIQIHSPAEIKEDSQSQIFTQSPPHKKSVFHNFQKHLISVLKKIVKIRKQDLQGRQFGTVAYKLLRLFHDIHSSNKKLLMVIFGFGESVEREIYEMSKLFPETEELLKKTSAQSVSGAQNLLRNIFARSIRALTLDALREGSKISKVDDFFKYLTRFADDLEEGFVTRRMRKNRKLSHNTNEDESRQ